MKLRRKQNKYFEFIMKILSHWPTWKLPTGFAPMQNTNDTPKKVYCDNCCHLHGKTTKYCNVITNCKGDWNNAHANPIKLPKDKNTNNDCEDYFSRRVTQGITAH